jgi:hypothetical protein
VPQRQVAAKTSLTVTTTPFVVATSAGSGDASRTDDSGQDAPSLARSDVTPSSLPGEVVSPSGGYPGAEVIVPP